MKVFRIILIAVGAFLVLDTFFAMTRCNMNLGVLMPIILGLPMLLLGVFLPHMQQGFLSVLKWVILGGYMLGIVIFAICGILMRSAISEKHDSKADALIVLGAALHGDRVTWVLSNRLDAAIEYANMHPEAVIAVSGGQGSGETRPEGDAMRDYMVARGIDPSRIIVENRATNTRENFAYSMVLIRDRLGDEATVAYVTTDFHVFRSGRVARSMGIEAKGVAADDVWYIRMNNFMRESVGIVIYWLTGRLS